ncbi:ATP synthase subunit I [Cupriavidus basilensis]|uniref:ATP synthase subunit I n=1 Tax=Cupriavidus basilensis TaxID=68895 RepID=A0ABT6APU7_9BURK|nr:ATP synthase subunit I [Cupriavidus basilensis]MDF3834474.1 ATP synthase subunit I [Cupriavidus basilensis]
MVSDRHDASQKKDWRTRNAWDEDEAEREEEAVDPLSRAEAETLFGKRALRPSRMTPGRVVLAQVAVTVLSAIAWRLFAGGNAGAAGWSALFGGAVCFVPSGFFALRLWLSRERTSISGLVVGEAIKVFATVALFVLVVVLYRELRWVPMLVTFLLALKTYWVALAIR